jgi:hypothetical protein
MSALEKVITNYRAVNPFGSSHQQLADEAAAELAALREAIEAAREVVVTKGVPHHGNAWNYYKVKAEELDALITALAKLDA